MKSWWKPLLTITVILLISAVLSPILFQFLPFKFERIFNRLVMIFSIIAAVLFVRISKETFRNYGLLWSRTSGSFIALGFFSGVAVLTAVIFIRIQSGSAVLSVRDYPMLEWGIKAIKIVGAAFLIGVLEEFFFRGFIYQSLRARKAAVPAAFFVTNIFYSSLHFISVKKIYIGPEPVFVDSLKLIIAPFLSFMQWELIWPGLIGLFLFGCILNYLTIRTGSLYPAIGLHAGCVFMVKSDGLFVDFLHTDLMLGSSKVYDGVLGWLFLVALWMFYRLYFRNFAKTHFITKSPD